jgi:hypothetical protein
MLLLQSTTLTYGRKRCRVCGGILRQVAPPCGLKVSDRRRGHPFLERERRAWIERAKVCKKSKERVELRRAPIRPHPVVERQLAWGYEYTDLRNGVSLKPDTTEKRVKRLHLAREDECRSVGDRVDRLVRAERLGPKVPQNVGRALAQKSESVGNRMRVYVVDANLGQRAVVRVE